MHLVHRKRPHTLLLGVGAAFDFHSGRVDRAPHWMRRFGLEWLFRTLQEPRRLGPRYAKTNLMLLGYLLGLALTRGYRRLTP
jgi:N-acetylglucosaminyldiphosphoundecaprenol N-acetyl-beta-D-mannosaminyltransferase